MLRTKTWLGEIFGDLPSTLGCPPDWKTGDEVRDHLVAWRHHYTYLIATLHEPRLIFACLAGVGVVLMFLYGSFGLRQFASVLFPLGVVFILHFAYMIRIWQLTDILDCYECDPKQFGERWGATAGEAIARRQALARALAQRLPAGKQSPTAEASRSQEEDVKSPALADAIPDVAASTISPGTDAGSEQRKCPVPGLGTEDIEEGWYFLGFSAERGSGCAEGPLDKLTIERWLEEGLIYPDTGVWHTTLGSEWVLATTAFPEIFSRVASRAERSTPGSRDGSRSRARGRPDQSTHQPKWQARVAVTVVAESVGDSGLVRYVRHEQRPDRCDPRGLLLLSYTSIPVSSEVGADSALQRSLCCNPVLWHDDGTTGPCEGTPDRSTWRKEDGATVRLVVTTYQDRSCTSRREEQSPDPPWYTIN